VTLSSNAPRDVVGPNPGGVFEYQLPAVNVAFYSGQPVGMNNATGIAGPLVAGLRVIGVVPDGAARDLTTYTTGTERVLVQARPFVFPQDSTFQAEDEASPYAPTDAPVYWDSSANKATASDAGGANAYLGQLIRAKSATEVHVDVRPRSVPPSLLAAGIIAPVRGVVVANVADLAAFTVAANDGLTYTAGQRVLLAAQTTAAQCGIYVVGTVAAGVAPLTRAADLPTGASYVPGATVEVSEGDVFYGSTWKIMATGTKIVGTDDPLFYPRSYRKTITLASGTYTIGAGGGSELLFLWSTTKSSVQATRNTAGGTLTLTTHYYVPVLSRIPGKAGTAAVAVLASVAAGTINTADNSTIDVLVENW
jgi:hypothetical protein